MVNRTTVRTLLMSAVVLGAVLGAVSCDFFSYSIYSDALTAIDRSADLSSDMKSLNTSQTVMDAFDDGSHEYVFILQNDVNTVHLVVLDENMKVIFTGDDPGFGRFHVVDTYTPGNPMITVGNLEFSPAADPIVLTPMNPSPVIENRAMGFYATMAGDYVTLVVDNSTSTATLQDQLYSTTSHWASGVGGSSPAISSMYYVNDLRRVSVDPNTDTVSLVFSGDSGFYLYRFAADSFSSIATNFLDDGSAVVINTENSGDQVAPTPNGYVVLSQNGPSPTITYTSTIDGSSSALGLYKMNNPRIAASPDGSYVYVLSTGDRKLFKLKRWW
jgi:hypothetical protein